MSVTHTGKVKWFNNKSGYGFITFIDNSEYEGKDVFAHHSSLKLKSELYKFLIEGEYVHFNIEKIENKNHEFQAINITGINGHELMCEVKNKNKTLKMKH
tara:strand:+ start:276 stop:575 length:300 start_codon:yes stop_codon:yes gene_type:complete